MRILHTSDWHLGRTLHGVDLLEHQAAFVDHLVELVVERESTSSWWRATCTTGPCPRCRACASSAGAAAAERARGRRRHAGQPRLGRAARLRGRADATGAARARLGRAPSTEPVVVARRARAGRVLRAAVPGPRHRAAHAGRAVGCRAGPGCLRRGGAGAGPRRRAPSRSPRSHEAVVAAAMDRVRADLAARPGTRSVVVAHAFVAGGEPPATASATSASAGSTRCRAAVFAGVDYVALGHLHGAQRVGAGPRRAPVHPLLGLAAGLLVRRARARQVDGARRPRGRRVGRRSSWCRRPCRGGWPR